jgi:hypothetical protein
MTSLLIVLFFALTGITLNHPTWFGAAEWARGWASVRGGPA